MSDIQGYRELTEDDLNQVNSIKDSEVDVSDLWKVIRSYPGVDPRWLAVAKTHFQEGFSALVRSVTKPTDPFDS